MWMVWCKINALYSALPALWGYLYVSIWIKMDWQLSWLLLKKDIMNAFGFCWSTALVIAAQIGQHECLSILLAHGAEVDKANEVSVLRACPSSWWICSRLFGKIVSGTGQMCCDQCCLCTHQDGCTALMIAALQGQHECLSILFAHGADAGEAAKVSAGVWCICRQLYAGSASTICGGG